MREGRFKYVEGERGVGSLELEDSPLNELGVVSVPATQPCSLEKAQITLAEMQEAIREACLERFGRSDCMAFTVSTTPLRPTIEDDPNSYTFNPCGAACLNRTCESFYETEGLQ